MRYYMDLLFKQTVTVESCDTNHNGILKLSALLHYVQEISGAHSDRLGHTWDSLAGKNLFWAVLRHRAVIHRLPKAGQTVHLQTWPMPATRSAYPRAVQAFDEQGNILFETVSLWVLMNTQTRAMVLPGKSGIDVPGILRGNEITAPGSLSPCSGENTSLWSVCADDLDINGHVNNANYMDHAERLIGQLPVTPKEFTVCYLAEALLGQAVTLHWCMSADGILSVDGTRPRADDQEKTERVFAVKLSCSVNQSEL